MNDIGILNFCQIFELNIKCLLGVFSCPFSYFRLICFSLLPDIHTIVFDHWATATDGETLMTGKNDRYSRAVLLCVDNDGRPHVCCDNRRYWLNIGPNIT